MITTLYADITGNIYDAPFKQALGQNGKNHYILKKEDLIKLPKGASLTYLPGHEALYQNNEKISALKEKFAVAALLPLGYTRTFLPASRKSNNSPILPLYGYTAVALYKDEIHVTAIKHNDNEKWDPKNYDTATLKKNIKLLKNLFPKNRLVNHLENCSLNWHCYTAQNLFYNRWEMGIPVSKSCNANCLGCISLQTSECCQAPQSRITFTPLPEEVAEIGIYHLKTASQGIVSFGQGCEGEPSLEFEIIAKAIKQIRNKTKLNQININTNAGFTLGIKEIVNAGLDSMRVSIISANEDIYKSYYRCNYSLSDVIESIKYAKKNNIHVSLNMLLFPGLNDQKNEVDTWIRFLKETKVDMIQLRNLNFDPNLFLEMVPPKEASIGINNFIESLNKDIPNIKIGSFTEYIK